MPEVANFVAKLREAFGDATIDEAVARGKAGEPAVFARERMGGRSERSPWKNQSLAGRR